MTLFQMHNKIRKLRKSEKDVNPAILKIYNKALRAANKAIKEELGDIEPWQIKWTE